MKYVQEDVARQVKKIYVGVDGVARLCYSGQKGAYKYGLLPDLDYPRFGMGNASLGVNAIFFSGGDMNGQAIAYVDAYYTGYHWTKAVCQTCGTINPGSGYLHYGFNNNVYGLYPCDNNFYLQFDNTTYENHERRKNGDSEHAGKRHHHCG